MAESPSTMQHVQYIHYLLNELVEHQNLQNEAVTAIQNEILATMNRQNEAATAIQKEMLAAMKRVEIAIESLHATYRASIPPPIPLPGAPTIDIPPQFRKPRDETIQN